MKRLLKFIYTRLLHPRLFLFNKRIGKGVFVGKRAFVNNRKYLTIGERVRIGNDFEARFYDEFADRKYKPQLIIEDDCYIGNRFKVLSNDKVVLKKHALLASDIMITTENHGMDVKSGVKYGLQPLSNRPVELGEYCWIGEKVVILPGVTIGKWAVVAAGAIVTRSVEPYTVVAGNPARPIKKYDFEKECWVKVEQTN